MSNPYPASGYREGPYVWGGAAAQTYTVRSPEAARPTAPFAVAAFNPSEGDLLDLTEVDASTAASGTQAWTLVSRLQGHGGQCVLVALATGAYHLLGDRDGDGVADFVVSLQTTGAQTAWVDVASHILL